MKSNGLLLCARYSAAPNFFGYCGPEENASLVDHLKEKVTDKEIKVILSGFDTLYAYLRLISTENNIIDPFDQKVVEAYWIGNSLLETLSNRNYVYLLQEKLALEKKMGGVRFQKVKEKLFSTRFYPHHAFHVFNIFKRTGNHIIDHTLETMDSCRIGFGQVTKINVNKISTSYRPLTNSNNKLGFGPLSSKELMIDFKGKSFINNLKVGDWVSSHWGYVCDVLTERRSSTLQFYTKLAIDFFNQ